MLEALPELNPIKPKRLRCSAGTQKSSMLKQKPIHMPSLHLELHIGPDELLAYYRGAARSVHATTLDGRTVNFPASALQRHVMSDGVQGRFRLDFDDHHKFIGLERVEPNTGIDHLA